MSWIGIAVGGSTLLGAVNANEQQQAQKKQNLAAAEANRYSNWTGQTHGQSFGAPSVLGGAVQGGIGGLGAARMFGAGAAKPEVNGFTQKYGQGAATGIQTAGPDHAGGMASNPYGGMLQGGRRTLFGN